MFYKVVATAACAVLFGMGLMFSQAGSAPGVRLSGSQTAMIGGGCGSCTAGGMGCENACMQGESGVECSVQDFTCVGKEPSNCSSNTIACPGLATNCYPLVACRQDNNCGTASAC